MENEYARKAEILKHLIGTLSWPKDVVKDNTIHICIWGKLTDSKPFNDLNGVISGPYKISIRQSSTLDDTAKNCQIIFISKSQEAQAKKIIQRFAKKPVLLLGDMDNFARDGGSMNFMKLNNGLALSVNLVGIKDSNLVLDLKAYSQITIFPDKKDLEES
jgi:hypothetical protein